MNKELSASIRNKLQGAKTALELLAKNKDVPRKFIVKALKALKDIEKLI